MGSNHPLGEGVLREGLYAGTGGSVNEGDTDTLPNRPTMICSISGCQPRWVSGETRAVPPPAIGGAL